MTKRSPRKKSDIVLLAIIDDEVRFPISETVAVLHRDDRNDLACALELQARTPLPVRIVAMEPAARGIPRRSA